MMEYFKTIELIKRSLIKSQDVSNINENATDIMAISFIDIEESNKKINLLINKLISGNELTEEEVNDILYEIGDEFRHILYHLKDMRFYDYLDERKI